MTEKIFPHVSHKITVCIDSPIMSKETLSGKIFVTCLKFCHYTPLKLNVQNYLQGKIFVIQQKFRHFSTTKFSPLRYVNHVKGKDIMVSFFLLFGQFARWKLLPFHRLCPPTVQTKEKKINGSAKGCQSKVLVGWNRKMWCFQNPDEWKKSFSHLLARFFFNISTKVLERIYSLTPFFLQYFSTSWKNVQYFVIQMNTFASVVAKWHQNPTYTLYPSKMLLNA